MLSLVCCSRQTSKCVCVIPKCMGLQARNYLVAHPNRGEQGSRNAVIAAEKLSSSKAERPGVSEWRGRLSVTSHKGVERLGDFVCTDWPDHIAK